MGLRTYGRNRGWAAPQWAYCSRASLRLRAPFTVRRTSPASASSWPSSSHQQTGHSPSAPGASSVLYPQHGQRKRACAKAPTIAWTRTGTKGFTRKAASRLLLLATSCFARFFRVPRESHKKEQAGAFAPACLTSPMRNNKSGIRLARSRGLLS